MNPVERADHLVVSLQHALRDGGQRDAIILQEGLVLLDLIVVPQLLVVLVLIFQQIFRWNSG